MNKWIGLVAIVIGLGALMWWGEFVWSRFRFPRTVVSEDGIASKQWGLTLYSLKWKDVRRIDAGVEGTSYLGIRLFADELYEIWDTDNGFGDLVEALLKRWPGIGPRWETLSHVESPFWITLWERR